MIRRFPALGLCACALLLSACGSSASTAVTASLGAASLPAINLPPYLPGPLNGMSTPRSLALRRPLAVILENYAPDSRPQSGLSAASTVFETLAEGGVTRFLAIYLEHDASRVGPVRSTRVYFDHWASGLHAIFTHVGGNDDAQALLFKLPSVFNIDENRWEISIYNTGTPLFWRSTDRLAPHNMYVSTYKLRSYATQNTQNWSYAQAYFLHKNSATLGRRGHKSTIDISFLDPLGPQPNAPYAVRYQFDRATDTYAREMGGAPHVDALTGKAIQPANVIIMHTDQGVADPLAGPTALSISLRDLGSGKAEFFIDGKVINGTWRQRDQFAPLRFSDGRGHQVALNPGQTWIELVPRGSPVTWSAG